MVWRRGEEPTQLWTSSVRWLNFGRQAIVAIIVLAVSGDKARMLATVILKIK